jgi:hypothetical protein
VGDPPISSNFGADLQKKAGIKPASDPFLLLLSFF